MLESRMSIFTSCSVFTNESLLRNVWLAINNKRSKVTDDKACWLSRASYIQECRWGPAFFRPVFITALSVLLPWTPLFLSFLFPHSYPSPFVTKTDPTPPGAPSSSPALGELFFDLSWRCSWPVINIREQLSPLLSSRPSATQRKRCPADFSRTPLSLPRKVKLLGSPRIQRIAPLETKIDHPTSSFSGVSVTFWIPRATRIEAEKLR